MIRTLTLLQFAYFSSFVVFVVAGFVVVLVVVVVVVVVGRSRSVCRVVGGADKRNVSRVCTWYV